MKLESSPNEALGRPRFKIRGKAEEAPSGLYVANFDKSLKFDLKIEDDHKAALSSCSEGKKKNLFFP